MTYNVQATSVTLFVTMPESDFAALELYESSLDPNRDYGKFLGSVLDNVASGITVHDMHPCHDGVSVEIDPRLNTAHTRKAIADCLESHVKKIRRSPGR